MQKRIIVPLTVEVAVDPSDWARLRGGQEFSPEALATFIDMALGTGLWAHCYGAVSARKVTPQEAK